MSSGLWLVYCVQDQYTWIYGTISSSLLDSVLKTRRTARELWIVTENMFSRHQGQGPCNTTKPRTLNPNNRGSLTLSVHQYFLMALSVLLANVDSPVSKWVVVVEWSR